MAEVAYPADAVGAQVSAQMSVDSRRTPIPMNSSEYSEVLSWLYREAQLLDRGEFAAWLELLAEDIEYDMPARTSVLPRDGAGFHPEFGHFAENYASMTARVRRLQTNQAWAEQPRSRTRHYISNVLIERAADDYYVTAAMLVTRLRANRPLDVFCGERQDLVRRQGAALKLARRRVLLDQTVLESHNLSIFF